MATKTASKSAQKPTQKPASKPAAKKTKKPAKAKTGAAKAETRRPAAPKSAARPATAKKALPAAKKATPPAKSAKPAAANPKSSPASEPVAKTAATAPKAGSPAKQGAPKAQPAGKPAPASKSLEKEAPKPAAKPAAKDVVKSAAKPSAAPKIAEKPSKKDAANKKLETPEKKKPLVGQKPRSDKPASASDALPLPIPPKASSPVNTPVSKASPASAEAKLDFKVNDHVVYPAHGVGRIVGIERQLIAGVSSELFLIDFEQEKMKLRVPTAKAKAVGMRALSDTATVKKAIETLKGRARIKRTMWSRRAQEYEAKINSGDIHSVAEVVRDLYRASDQPEQSYSERQLFEAALDRLAREVAAVHKTDLAGALAELDAALQQKKAA